AGMLPAELASCSLHLREGLQHGLLIAAEPARVAEDDRAQLRQALLQREHLVDLFLILGDDHRHLGMIQHVDELACDRVLVDRHGNSAERLRGKLRPVKARAIVADDRELVATPESRRGEAERYVMNVVVVRLPTVSSPDAAILLADSRRTSKPFGVAPYQLRERTSPRFDGERVEFRGHGFLPR